jgi:hypothetical protein
MNDGSLTLEITLTDDELAVLPERVAALLQPAAADDRWLRRSDRRPPRRTSQPHLVLPVGGSTSRSTPSCPRILSCADGWRWGIPESHTSASVRDHPVVVGDAPEQLAGVLAQVGAVGAAVRRLGAH